MKQLLCKVLIFIVIFCAVTPVKESASVQKCSFARQLSSKGSSFFVSSRRALGCDVQILNITMQKNAKQYINYRDDVDYLAYSATTSDLDNDGIPELLVMSRYATKPGGDTVDLYKPDGAVLKKTSLPPLQETGGYGGGDSFWIDDKQLVRSFPLYDESGAITGTRTLKYELVNNQLALYVQSDTEISKPEDEQPAPKQQISHNSVALNPPHTQSAAGSLTDVQITETSIVIKTEGAVGTYKVMKLEKPERIAIDFPKGISKLNYKSILVGKFGVTKVRVGMNKGFVRLVFDSKLKKFPEYSIKAESNAIAVEFIGVNHE